MANLKGLKRGELPKVLAWVMALITGGVGVLAVRFGVELWQNLAGVPVAVVAIGLVRWSLKQK